MDEFSKEKNQFIQVCCGFYNQHSELDKQWFAHNYDQCDEPHEKHNLCMHKWQFPLFALRSQQAEIGKLKSECALRKDRVRIAKDLIEAKDKRITELESDQALQLLGNVIEQKDARIKELEGMLNESK